ncbi:hypothetical protein EDD21DRAFT_349963 [Dissophora ornata]|nr:hypothetical protein BGZ58_009549 [Dissophora ornata]KAI8605510.1 hypothetical protein EDD21DRAFT_349963 [Dissophora ornata]
MLSLISNWLGYGSSEVTYNILLLGKTQAGKSTFAEALRKYADQTTDVDYSLIGNGNVSHTSDIRTHNIATYLPGYEIMETYEEYGFERTQILDYNELIQTADVDDYTEALNRRKGIQMRQGKPSSRAMCRFNIIDTPGLDDTNNRDEMHVSKIYSKLMEVQTIHLVLFLVSGTVMTTDLQNAIRCYGDMFPELKGVMAFVHTQINYDDLHPTRTSFSEHLEAKKQVLHSIMGRDNFQHFAIDCDLATRRPIRQCITQNTIQGILSLATFNQPVVLRMVMINKTPRMKETDCAVSDRFKAMSETMTSIVRTKSKEESEIMETIRTIEANICSAETRIREIRDSIAIYDVDDLELIFERYHSEEWGLFKTREQHEIKYSNPSLTLDHVDFRTDHVDILDRHGGENHNYCNVWFKRNSFENGYLQMKVYAKRSKVNRQKIDQYKSDLRDQETSYNNWIGRRNNQSDASRTKRADIQGLLDTQRTYIALSSRVMQEKLQPEVFTALALAGAYMGTLSQCADKVVEYYLKQK